MPPLTPRTAVNKGKIDIGDSGKKEVFEAFEGPSRPRLIYERPGGRELPKVRVCRIFVVNAVLCKQANGHMYRELLLLVGQESFVGMTKMN